MIDVGSADDVADFANRILAAHPALNVLVDNAGIMRFEALERTRDLADADATIATNLLGPIRLTNALVEHLAARRDPAVVNVTAGLAYVPVHVTPTYNATKAAIHSYTLSLRKVLRGKVEVIESCRPRQTGLTPNQETRPGYVPLGAFVDEVMQLLGRHPTGDRCRPRPLPALRRSRGTI